MQKANESGTFFLSNIFQRIYIAVIFCYADIIAFFLYLKFSLDLGRKQAIRTNIKTIFPALSFSDEKQLIHKYNKEMGKVGASYFVLDLMPIQYMSRIVTYDNLQLLNGLYKEGKSVVLLFPHYNNWTYITTLPLFTGYKVFATHGTTPSKYLDKVRNKHGTVLIPQNRAYRTILKSKNDSPSLYIILADQLPIYPFKNWVTFFNKKVYIQTGSERIIKHTNSTAVYLDIRKISKYHYNYSFRLFSNGEADHTKLLQMFYTELEEKIKARPHLWFRWFTNKWDIEFIVGNENHS